MKVKTVAVLVKYFPSLSETFIVNQINALINNGLKVTLLSYNKVEGIPIHKSIHNHDLLDQVQYFNKPPKSKLKRLTFFLKWIFQHAGNIDWALLIKCCNVFLYGKEAYTLKLFYEMQWFLLRHDYDIIHAHFAINASRISHLKKLKLLPTKTKLITTFHGYDLVPNQLNDYKLSYKDLLKESDKITINTTYLQDLLIQIDPTLKKLIQLPVGLDTNTYKRTAKKADLEHFDIVFCGRLIALKGPDLAIKIVKRLNDMQYKNIRLHIIGTGKMLDELKTMIHNFNLDDSVFLHGALAQDDVIKRLEKSDVFLLPGRYDKKTGRAEAQGLVIQEAQAMELPVIVSDVGGMKYGLIPNETGFVIKENDIDGFTKAIIQLANHDDLKSNMGKKARQFVVENYDSEVLVKKLIMLYNTN